MQLRTDEIAEVAARPCLEHDDSLAGRGERGRVDSSGRAGTDDRDVDAFFGRRPCAHGPNE